MRKFFTLVLFLSIIFYSYECFAGVQHISDVPQNTVPSKASAKNPQKHCVVIGKQAKCSDTKPTIEIQKSCRKKGYKKTSCNPGETPANHCPENQSYFKECIPAT